MILNEKQMHEARLLAKEFVKIEEAKQSFRYALETVGRLLEDVKESVISVWESMYDNVTSINDTKKRDIDIRESWHVPIKIKAPPIPNIPMPRMMNIRSEL